MRPISARIARWRISPELKQGEFSGSVHHYRAYGLAIGSALALPELASSPALNCDVTIDYDSVEGPLPENGLPRLIRLDEDGLYLAWPFIGRFRVATTGRIIVDPLTDNVQHLRFALLGPVLAGYLHLRGTPLLHGSAVRIGDRALLFVGRKGAGKSTAAAALAAAGCEVLSDDVIALEQDGGAMAILPGFASLKLSQAAREELLPRATVIGADEAGAAKRMVRQDANSTAPMPIGAMFFLNGRGSSASERRMTPAETMGDLLGHSYALKFGDKALTGSAGARHFETCAALARHIPAWDLTLPDALERLPSFASSLLEEHSILASG